MVLLGEFVWKRQRSVRSATLVAALSALDVSENAARKAIHRLAKTGMIQSQKNGREAHCSLTDKANAVFEEGSTRVFGFPEKVQDWNGQWFVVSVSVPDAQRKSRHYLQSRLVSAGMGSPSPGIWISPHTHISVESLITDLGLADGAISFIGSFGPIGIERKMVQAAWDLGELEGEYQAFIDAFAYEEPRTKEAAFRAYVNLVQTWRRFPYIDPNLPAEFLPSPWIGEKAARLMHARRDQWADDTFSFWADLQTK